eukprot:TRINITY_DN1581_c0_g1_i1.p3 TRINITY_DN1581_c0_g1~~TRINITY_DN1581_c0_g1_i1.p3  ORF type:complete len:110 (+),score=10.17 TRINITY_DN1581_c0_g1_i1:37-330(+)
MELARPGLGIHPVGLFRPQSPLNLALTLFKILAKHTSAGSIVHQLGRHPNLFVVLGGKEKTIFHISHFLRWWRTWPRPCSPLPVIEGGRRRGDCRKE